MHAALPVRMSLAPDRAWSVAVALLAGVAAANLAAWAALHVQAPVVTTVAATLLAAAVAAWWGRRVVRGPSAGVLAWDGAAWQWSVDAAPPQPCDLRVMVDLGGWLLLRLAPFAPTRRRVWVVASRRMAGPLWPVWRTALYASRRVADPAAATDLT